MIRSGAQEPPIVTTQCRCSFGWRIEKVRRVEERIVSLHKPWVRPIKRGKEGKEVEFGPKAAVSHVNGFTFLDHAGHDNFNEAKWLSMEVEAFAERFGRKPEWCVGDNLYGSRENRGHLKKLRIRDSFVPLGGASGRRSRTGDGAGK